MSVKVTRTGGSSGQSYTTRGAAVRRFVQLTVPAKPPVPTQVVGVRGCPFVIVQRSVPLISVVAPMRTVNPPNQSSARRNLPSLPEMSSRPAFEPSRTAMVAERPESRATYLTWR